MKKIGIISGKKSTYNIVDEKGNIIASGFWNITTARQNIPRYKLNKRDKLKIIEVKG